MSKQKDDPALDFATAFTDYYRRKNFNGARLWKEDPEFVVRIGEDYFKDAKHWVRAGEERDFFAWIEREYDKFVELNQIKQVAQRWSRDRMVRNRSIAEDFRFSPEFRATVEDWGFCADMLKMKTGEAEFGRAGDYSSQVLHVWQIEAGGVEVPMKKALVVLENDKARSEAFFCTIRMLLKTEDRMKRLEAYHREFHDNVKRLAGAKKGSVSQVVADIAKTMTPKQQFDPSKFNRRQ